MRRSKLWWSCLGLLGAVGLAGCESSPGPHSKPSSAPTTSAAATGTASAKAKVQTVTGFKTPESVLYVPDQDVYLVANINGGPLEADDNGFISRVTPDGKIEALKWIDGAKGNVKLSAPKGMAISKGVLYVTDITHVRLFDAKSGAPRGDIAVKDATFLNDLATGPDGTVYLSDMGMKAGSAGFEPSGTDAIYKVDAQTRRATVIIKDETLYRPNGLFVDAKGLWVVTHGSNELYRIDDNGKKADERKLPKGSLDGLVIMPDGRLLISSWAAKTVYVGPHTGPFEPLITGVNAPADIGYDTKRDRVLVPLFNDHEIQLHPLK